MNHLSQILLDQPIQSFNEDRLGFSPTAQTFATSLAHLDLQKGFAVSITGLWGSGKTSFINLTFAHLTTLSPENPPLIVRFSPWRSPGQEEMLLAYLKTLRKDMGAYFTELASVLGSLEGWVDTLANLPLGPWSAILKFLKQVFGSLKKPDFMYLKAKVAKDYFLY